MSKSQSIYASFFEKSNDFLAILNKENYCVIETNLALQAALTRNEAPSLSSIFEDSTKIKPWLQSEDEQEKTFNLSSGIKANWSCFSDNQYYFLTGKAIENSNTLRTEMQSIFDAFPDLAFKMDIEGTYLGYYSGMTPTFIPPEAFLGKKLSEIMPPYIAESQMALLEDCIDNQKIVSSQYSLPYPDGLHYFDSKYIPLPDGHCFVIVRETTEYTRVQELLEESQNKTKIGSWELDLSNEEVFWTEQIFNIYDIAPDSPHKSSEALDLYLPKDRILIQEEIASIINNKTTFDLKLKIQKKDNTFAWVNTLGYPLLNNEGQVIKIRGTLQDITESESIRLELQQNKDTLRLLIQHTPAAVAMFDKDMKYIAYSDRWLSDYNIQLEDITGMTHYEVFPDVKEEWKEDHQRVLNGEIYANPEDKWTREDGSVFYLKYVLRPWSNQEGSIGGIIMFTEVITEQVETRLQLEKSVEELINTNADLEQFAYVASHDLQEPLRMIGNFSQLLHKKYSDDLDEKGKKYLEIIFDAAKRMKGLIQNLLNYSSNDNKREMIKETDLEQLINEKIKDLSLLIDEKNAKIEFYNLPKSIYCAPNQLGMVFYNLILNAIKFNDKKSPIIEIRYKPGKKVDTFSVIDNGIGIEKKLVDKIFKIFQRLHPKKSYSGNGIGLAICKKTVEQMGGEIWHETNHYGGSTFSFTITKH